MKRIERIELGQNTIDTKNTVSLNYKNKDLLLKRTEFLYSKIQNLQRRFPHTEENSMKLGKEDSYLSHSRLTSQLQELEEKCAVQKSY